jgi:uncharacterized protein
MRKVLILPAVAALAAAAFISAHVMAQDTTAVSTATGDSKRTITVSGEGEVKTKPDMAMLTGGVMTDAPTAAEALNKNSTAMTSVLAAIKNAGVADTDVQTSNFNVSPVYAPYQPENPQPQKVTGYQVTNQVTVMLRDITKVGAVLDELVKVGSNSISGVSFGLQDPKPVLNQARQDAVKDAKAKADLYASAAGVSVGRVMTISESGYIGPPQPVYRTAAMESASVPIATGQETITATVSVTYEIQ